MAVVERGTTVRWPEVVFSVSRVPQPALRGVTSPSASLPSATPPCCRFTRCTDVGAEVAAEQLHPTGVAIVILALCIAGFLVYDKVIWYSSMGFISTAIFFPRFSLKFVITTVRFEAIQRVLWAVH